MTDRDRLAAGLVALLVAALAALAWRGATATGPTVGYDAEAHVAYSQVLASEKRLPRESDTYEYTTPPAYAALTAAAEAVAKAVGGGLEAIVTAATGFPAVFCWFLAAALAIGLIVRFRRGEAGWTTGAVLAALVLAAALVAVLAVSAETRWTTGQALSIVWMGGFVVVAYLLGREVWPGEPLVAALAAALTAAVPVTLRMGAMFHPEMQFAFICALALLLVVRGFRDGWSLRYGAALGGVLGLAAWTRQSAIGVAVILGIAVLVTGRRRALPFLATSALVLAVVAAGWWIRQGVEYGNPFKSNLERYILEDGQPFSFYLSAPIGDLVLHPIRPHFAGELWPQFHADLWGDWFGAQHDFWPGPPTGASRFFLSSQSVLGFVAEALAIVGLAAFGGGALARVWRGGDETARDVALAVGFLLATLAWIAFVVQLVRFPQGGGDPIKPSYLLFLAPVFAIGGLLSARWLWRRDRGWRPALLIFAGLCAVSYAGYLVTAYP